MRRFRNLKTAAIAGIFLVGTAFVANGLWIKGKAVVAQVLLDQAFLASAEGPVKPWPWADITPMGKLTAPGLAESSIIINGTSGEAMAFGPGHLYGTPMPGETGTSVLAGHRDTHFAWIKNLKPDDEVKIERPNGTTISYKVRRAWIARFDAPGIDADSSEKLLALTTCWPFEAKTQGDMRYVVEAVQIDIRTHEDSKAHDADDRDDIEI